MAIWRVQGESEDGDVRPAQGESEEGLGGWCLAGETREGESQGGGLRRSRDREAGGGLQGEGGRDVG